MDTNRIRFLDYWVGRPLCFALTAAARFGKLFQVQASRQPPKKIAFIKLIEQGATVLAVDALRRARELVGRENVYFCVFSENTAILSIVDLVAPENVIVIRNDGLVVVAWDILRALYRMRRGGIDATVDLEFFSRASAILAYLSGARTRSGVHRFTSEGPYRGNLMTRRVQYSAYLHTSQMYRLLVDALVMDAEEQPLPKVVPPPLIEDLPRFQPDSAMRARVRAMLPNEPGPLVLLNPNASDLMPLRKWPQERFLELAKKLLAARADVRVLLTGAPSEKANADALCAALGSPRVLNFAAKTTMPELMTLYTLSDVLVTNDSGPGHFASLTDIHAVVLFGPETPVLYGPLGKRCRIVMAGLACTPCVSAYNHRLSPCTFNRCMQDITVEQVFEAVETCLAERMRDKG